MRLVKTSVLVLGLLVPLATANGDDCDCPAKPRQTVATVCVDHARTLAKLVAAGDYARVSPDITEKNFPFAPSDDAVKTDIIVLNYGRPMFSDQVIVDMDRRGLRPATAQELLSLGAQRKDLPEKDTAIIALRTVVPVYGDRCVAYLGRFDRERHLRLFWFGLEWSEGARFAAVRK